MVPVEFCCLGEGIGSRTTLGFLPEMGHVGNVNDTVKFLKDFHGSLFNVLVVILITSGHNCLYKMQKIAAHGGYMICPKLLGWYIKVTAGCDLGLRGFKVKLMTTFLHAVFLRGKTGTGGPGRLL